MTEVACPFVYSTGKRCGGTIVEARAYGPPGQVKKYRLFCSDRWDHCGTATSPAGKDRMEFYPDQLPAGVEEKLYELDLLK